ncbi:MAG: helix-turn-helix domain-containing protein [Candidatus Aenigmarchaeota archaeon]|nr:helix-turn-helix domain-containing protein [Candidatus Aenigmarchaeota archaeon]
MKFLCEVIVQDVLPAMKALLAKELTHKYGLTQKQAAEKMGCTQAAVSQYLRELRGYKVKLLQKDEKSMEKLEELAKKLASGSAGTGFSSEICGICDGMRKRDTLKTIYKEIGASTELCTVFEKS